MKTGVANLPLHPGKAPRWLFSRMVELSGAISQAVVEQHSEREFLKRISDPYWFQALSCAIGFDWHSSGTTTTTCGALKTSLKPELGVLVAGGKGKNSRKTPEEIRQNCEKTGLSEKKIEKLVRASKLAAKVDNSLIQDEYALYHHCFFYTSKGDWAVVQQGMNQNWARRYHWLGEQVKSYVEEPHTGIACDEKKQKVLNLTSKESKETRQTSLDLVKDGPLRLKKYFKNSGQKTLAEYLGENPQLNMPRHHPVLNIDVSKKGWETLQRAYELQPKNYEELISLRGMGPKKIRALALVSQLIWGTKPSWKDPVKYSYAHGGKDGYPYPVDRKTYDHSIKTLKDAIEEAKIGKREKLSALKRIKDHV